MTAWPGDDDEQGRAGNGAGHVDRYPELPSVDVVVPDDASGLDRDLQALRREQRQAQRLVGPRLARRLGSTRGRRLGPSGPLTAAVLVVVAGFGAMLAFLGPDPFRQEAAEPLATDAAGVPGQVGGLLPDTILIGGQRTLAVRDVRPAVLALIPPACACSGQVRLLKQESQSFGLPLLLVGGSADPQLPELARVAGGLVGQAVDEDAELARVYAAVGLTVLVVDATGVVDAVVRDLPPTGDLQQELLRSTGEGSTSSG